MSHFLATRALRAGSLLARARSFTANPSESIASEEIRSNAATTDPLAAAPGETFRACDLEVQRSNHGLSLPEDLTKLSFGHDFAPHQLSVQWSSDRGWGRPVVKAIEHITLHPSAPVFHYGLGCFEGMKAYASEGKEGDVLMFRPEMNMERLRFSMGRLNLPSFDTSELLGCLKHLLKEDKDFVPRAPGYSLYLRPFAIGTNAFLGVAPATECEIRVITCPVGPYYPTGLVPIDLLLDEDHVRAFPGGTGQYKVGGNYAPTLEHLHRAKDFGCKQVLYTIPGAAAVLGGARGGSRYISECGAMNMFFLLENGKTGVKELVTPPLDGTILGGVTRDSILQLCREWDEFVVSERMISVEEIQTHARRGTLVEVFGSGTACVVQPVSSMIRENGERLETRKGLRKKDKVSERAYKALTDIQYGRIHHPWSESIY